MSQFVYMIRKRKKLAELVSASFLLFKLLFLAQKRFITFEFDFDSTKTDNFQYLHQQSARRTENMGSYKNDAT
jgi:hypothetical protein